MIFRIEFRTLNPELIELLKKVKGKKPYLIEKALIHFLSTKAGKETINALVGERDKQVNKKEVKKSKAKKKKASQDGEIVIDNFL